MSIRSQLKVIHGGLSPSKTPEVVPGATSLAEDELLRTAILRTAIEPLGITLLQALDEYSAIFDRDSEDDLDRGLELIRAVEAMGLRFSPMDQSAGYTRSVCYVLQVPERLKAKCPNLHVSKLHMDMTLG